MLEQLQRLLHVVRLFDEPLRIPFAVRHTEEVAAIHVNGTSQAPDRVRHGMDNGRGLDGRSGRGVAGPRGTRPLVRRR